VSRLRSALLDLGAVLGSLCLVVALAGLVLGVKPLVFRSGSMSPEIPAGALGFSRPASAAELGVGDVVSVVSANHERVTHRIVAIEGAGETRELTLQGDANSAPDAETYQVGRADRVFWSVPLVGYPLAWIGTPLGLVLLGGLVFAILVVIFRREQPPGGKRRASAMVAAPVALAVVVTTASGTSAAFTDTAATASGTIAAGSTLSPSPVVAPTADCSISGVAGLSQTATLRWTGVSAATGSAPAPASSYEYVIRVFNRSTDAQIGSAQTQAHAGAASSTQSVAYTASLLSNLFGINLLNDTLMRFEIRSRIAGTSWSGAAVVNINLRARSVLGLATLSCE
jgi:signal peptidase I